MIYEQHFSTVISVVSCDPLHSPQVNHVLVHNEKAGRSPRDHLLVATTSQACVLPCLQLTALLF